MPKAALIVHTSEIPHKPAKAKDRRRPNTTIQLLLRDLREQRRLAVAELRRVLRDLASAQEDLAETDAAIAALRAA